MSSFISSSPSFEGISGVLYNSGTTILKAYPKSASSAYYNIPMTVNDISTAAFAGSSITGVTLGLMTNTIGDYAFWGCSNASFTSFVVTSDISSIGKGVFAGCSALEEISVEGGTKFVSYDGDLYSLSGSHEDVLIAYPAAGKGIKGIDDSLMYCVQPYATAIEDYAFYGATQLREVIISERVETVGDYAFYGCSGLKSLVIPDNVESIGKYSYSGCTGATLASIGGKIQEIPQGAFAGDSALVGIVVSFDCRTAYTEEHGMGVDDGLTTITVSAGSISGTWYEWTWSDTVISQPGTALWTSANSMTFGNLYSISSMGTITNTSAGTGRYWAGFGSGYGDIYVSVGSGGSSAKYDRDRNDWDPLIYQGGYMGNVGGANGNLVKSTSENNLKAHATYYPYGVTRIYPAFCSSAQYSSGCYLTFITSSINSIFILNVSVYRWYVSPDNATFHTIDGNLYNSVGLVKLCGKSTNAVIVPEIAYGTDQNGNGLRGGNYKFIQYPEYLSTAKFDTICVTDVYLVHMPDSITDVSRGFFATPLPNMVIGDVAANVTAGTRVYNFDLPFVYLPGTGGVSINITSVSSLIYYKLSALIENNYSTVGLTTYSLSQFLKGDLYVNKAWFDDNSNWRISYDDTNKIYYGIAERSTGKGHVLFIVPENNSGSIPADFNTSIATLCTSLSIELSDIKAVYLGTGITSIGDNAFEGLTGMIGIDIPDSVTDVGDEAFLGCSSMEVIYIPPGTTSLGDDVFKGCSSLREIMVASKDPTGGTGNPNYSSEDGILYNKTRTTLIKCPEGKTGSVTVDTSTIAISDYAFYNASGVTAVTMPNGLTTIGESAFELASSIKNITIPSTVASLGVKAFFNCRLLTSVVFESGATGSIPANCFNGSTISAVDYTPDIQIIYFKGTGSAITFESTSHLDGDWYKDEDTTTTAISYDSDGSSTFAFERGSSYSKTQLTNNPNGPCGSGLKYRYMLNSYQLLIVYTEGTDTTGAMTEYNDGEVPWDSYKAAVRSITLPDGMTTISQYGFKGMTTITEVDIPDTVTSVGQYAFHGCTSLTDVDHNISDFAEGVFKGCTALNSIDIPSGSTVAESAFEGCTSLDNALVLDSAGANSFKNTAVTSVSVTGTGTTIGAGAFEGCTSLSSVTLSGISSVSADAFKGCTNASFTSVTIPDTVTSIGTNAFYGCSNLTTLSIPITLDAVNDADHPVFEGCTGFTTFTFTQGSNGVGVNYSTGNTGAPWMLGTNNKTVTIATGVKSVGDSMFEGCSYLTGMSISSSVLTDIYDDAFKGTAITAISLPASLITIGDYAFGDTAIQGTVTIPDAVTTVGDNAFRRSSSAVEDTIDVVFIGSSVETVGDYAFAGHGAVTTVILMGVSGTVRFGANVFSTFDGLVYTDLEFKLNGSGDTTYKLEGDIYRGTVWLIEGSTGIAIGESIGAYVNGNVMVVAGTGPLFSYDNLGVDPKAAWDAIDNVDTIIFRGMTMISTDLFIRNNIKSDLVTLMLPSGITSIGSNTFNGCDAIDEIYAEGSIFVGTLPYVGSAVSLGTDAFNGVSPDTLVLNVGDRVYTFVVSDGDAFTVVGNLFLVQGSVWADSEDKWVTAFQDGETYHSVDISEVQDKGNSYSASVTVSL
ncbi:MAG: leucine-rich repeat domain-containing protein [Candidatus Methanomethylophilaceae archaeon]|nr:leucine-rich repeat domain-containing protein [Candidatus Methanomethylophilaceae archaeon]